MVGVPTSRGCVACRKQKKKCSGDTAPCNRCRTLGVTCSGFGERRLKFQDESHKFTISRKEASSALIQATPPLDPSVRFQEGSCTILCIPANLSNAVTKLTATFAHGIDPNEDTTVQLPWNFGPFLEDIPRHLGVNHSLDTAADALVSAYDQFRVTGRATNELGLKKYSKALLALRSCLSEPEKACTTETLCAIMILMVFEILLGISDEGWMKHAGGAAKIFKYRGRTNSGNELEQKVLLSLRGPVVLQTLFLNKPYFTRSEWSLVSESELGADSIEEEAFRGLAQTVWLFQSARFAFSMQPIDQAEILDLELRTSYLREHMKEVMARFTPRFNALQVLLNGGPSCRWTRIAHAACARSFGLAMATQILINALLGALCGRGQEIGVLEQESGQFCREICALAGDVNCHRPLGTIYMTFVLRVAYVGAGEEAAKRRVRELLVEFLGDFLGERAGIKVEELEWLVRYLTLKDLIQD